MTKSEAIDIIRSCVAESLALDLEDISAESSLVRDLGADSLDFVDLVFMLEKRFGIKLQSGVAEFMSQLDFSSPDVLQNGFLTQAALTQLQAMMPGLAGIDDPGHVTPRGLFSLITVETLFVMVNQKLEIV